MANVAIPLGSNRLERTRSIRERIDIPRRVTLIAAILVVLVVALLLAFIGIRGTRMFFEGGVPLTQIFSATWDPGADPGQQTFGLLPFILGTIGVMVVAAIIAAPLSIGLAIFMSEIAPDWARNITRPAMEVFVGIPSVVYGFLGANVLVDVLRSNFHQQFPLGYSWFAGSLVLSIMILPTITSIAYDALITVPGELRTGSLALGTTRWQMIRHILLPAARAGLMTAVILGMLRAAGEALAVQMVIGNRAIVPTGIGQPIITLTSGITLDMGNTTDNQVWNMALWTMGLILLLMSLTFVFLARRIGRRGAAI
ncbi:MAG TPA: phosphate ABC transporter permease subunit PstC [Candidatus Limnocylindrales bacterium]|jgi:phosphate transport system permease protein|nr:phosphate ABC transporter permease subunit PstC [Candidatus Limnocylindrales bacterium]